MYHFLLCICACNITYCILPFSSFSSEMGHAWGHFKDRRAKAAERQLGWDTGRWMSETLWANCTVLGPCTSEDFTAPGTLCGSTCGAVVQTRWFMENTDATPLQQWCQQLSAVEQVSLTLNANLMMSWMRFNSNIWIHLVPKIEEMNRCQVHQSPLL